MKYRLDPQREKGKRRAATTSITAAARISALIACPNLPPDFVFFFLLRAVSRLRLFPYPPPSSPRPRPDQRLDRLSQSTARLCSLLLASRCVAAPALSIPAAFARGAA